jgi:HlyD family secretion protein
MTTKNKRKLVRVAGAVLLLLLVVWAFRPRPETADLAAVERAHLRVTLDEEGETRVRDRFVVSAPLAGRVLRIELEPGDPVTANETVLATFQPQAPILLDVRSRAEAEANVRAARANLDRARADRDRAEAELDFAKAEVERFRRLAGERIVSDEELESAELAARSKTEAYEAAEFSAQTARYQLEVARARLLPGTGGSNPLGESATPPISLRSPVNGVVLRRLRESEAVVPAGEPLLEVGQPNDLEIVADYLSADAVKIRPGDRALIEEWGGNKPLWGRVRRVEPSGFMKISALGVEEQRVNVVVDFVNPPDERLGLADGFRVELKVVLWEGQDVLQVPTGSLFRASEEWAVFAVEAGRIKLRKVEIGRRSGLVAEVVSGLEEGDQVVLHPGDSIVDGLRVEQRPG